MTPAGRRAAAAHRLRHPAGRPVPAPDHRRQRGGRAAAAGLAERRARASGSTSCSTWSASTPAALPRPLPERALRRRAPAGRRGPRARRRPAGDAHGRAVRRGRPDRPRAAPERVPAPPGAGAQDDRVRHPRHRRGDQDGRPHRHPAARRHPGPVRHAGRDPRQPRVASSSRASSAPIAASSACRWRACATSSCIEPVIVRAGEDRADVRRRLDARRGARLRAAGRRRGAPARLDRPATTSPATARSTPMPPTPGAPTVEPETTLRDALSVLLGVERPARRRRRRPRARARPRQRRRHRRAAARAGPVGERLAHAWATGGRAS